MSRLSESNRCSLFEKISQNIWLKIIRSHQVAVNVSEIGITADVITEILQYRKSNFLPNFDIYARNSYKEATYGSDIDIFIETEPSRYIWFALQAKVLKTDGTYDKLKYKSDGNYQWEKLLLLEGVTGCKSYYLLYNGVDEYKDYLTDCCGRSFSEMQFGCSLVDTIEIKKAATKTTSKVNFYDLHPKPAQPWRILTCCYHELEGLSLYSLPDIVNSLTNFKMVTTTEDLVQNNVEENSQGNFIDSDNAIIQASQQVGWSPDFRIVIHRSDNEKYQKYK